VLVKKEPRPKQIQEQLHKEQQQGFAAKAV